jgi:hypothetical protein
MLVTSNLLFLKQIEKAPALTGAFSFGGDKLEAISELIPYFGIF